MYKPVKQSRFCFSPSLSLSFVRTPWLIETEAMTETEALTETKVLTETEAPTEEGQLRAHKRTVDVTSLNDNIDKDCSCEAR